VNRGVVLIPIDRDGSPRGHTDTLSEAAREALRATAGTYRTAGFEEPWIGYLALSDRLAVGTCGFKGAPSDGRVEIAYFTFPGFEGRGFATAMAARLVALAQAHGSRPTVAAQTLPQRGASHRVLEKMGFQHVDTIQHPEDGTVWEWRLPPTRRGSRSPIKRRT
jgi:RimJ/RimL family protein N-acetyltransferase